MARTKTSERARSRTLTDDEIRAVWSATGKHPGPFSSLVRFILLTATRRNEAAGMTWGEIDKHGDWTIPAARYKTKADMLIPLSKAAMAVLDAVPVIGRKDGPIFTSDGEQPFTGFGYAKMRLDQIAGVTGWRVHDLRRTARSLMSKAGVPADHAERCLGHVIGGVRGTYDRYAYRDEKAAAFEKLAELIASVIN
jgi:integrase